ncbi:rRNA pseudouridine synthase [Candidatus Saccharibacteria bacterium]|nr:rRNA pseudouridine synthase [Candidatus Saccharibacteria bacterium]
MEIRLNKFLAERLGLSRREADDAIADGRVKVDGEVATLGARVSEQNKVVFDGQLVKFEKDYTYLLFNKPIDYVCSRKKQGEADTIYSLLPEKYHSLKTVGRLDKDSSGLILLTDDGDFAYKMTHPSFKKYKVYVVALDQSLSPLHQQMIADFGVDLPDGKSRLMLSHLDSGEVFEEAKSFSTPPVERKIWQVEMSEGRNRQIRRTFAALGYRVVFLKRVQFDNFTLDDLRPGQFREIRL